MQKKSLLIDSIFLTRPERNVSTLIQVLTRETSTQECLPVVFKAQEQELDDKYTILSNSNFIAARQQMGFHSVECLVVENDSEVNDVINDNFPDDLVL